MDSPRLPSHIAISFATRPTDVKVAFNYAENTARIGQLRGGAMALIAQIPGRYRDLAQREAIGAAIGARRRSTRCANLGPFTGYRIGLDIGNGNIGWCILFEDRFQLHFLSAEDIAALNAALPRNATRLQLPDLANFVPIGTHKFQAREPGEKGEKSFSRIRAEKRASMRLLDARQRRRLLVREALVAAGLLPSQGEELQGHTKTPADQLRALLLDRAYPTHRHDLGRALYNVLKRRGYMPPIGRKGQDEESGFGKSATAQYREALNRFGCATIGEFLERCARDARADNVRFRKRHHSLEWQKLNRKKKDERESNRSYEAFRFLTPTFDLIREEARLLRERQQHNVPISDEAWAQIEAAAEFRRPLKAKTPGRCRYFPKEFRCVRALPSFQEFRILEQASHLRDATGAPLAPDAFEKVVSHLKRVRSASLRELSGVLGARGLRLEGDDDKARRTLRGARTDIALSEALGGRWMELPLEERDRWTMRFLRRHWPEEPEPPAWRQCDEDALRSDAETAFGPGALEKVDDRSVAYELEDTFANLSLKAVEILSDGYRRRLSHDELMARLVAAGAPEPNLSIYDRLPYYGEVMPEATVPATGFAPANRLCAEEAAYGRAANPDLHVVLNRVRKVVNAIIEMMGGILPTTCVVEVARSALSEEDANKYAQLARGREKRRKEIEGEIAHIHDELGLRRPIGPALDRLVDRWKAAERQGWRDYDGSWIQKSALIDGGEYQLDHIVPRAFGEFQEGNLFVSRFNRQKGACLPWQAFGENERFRGALLAFAQFGFEKRKEALQALLRSRPNMPAKRKTELKQRIEQTEERLAALEKYGTPQPDVLASLNATRGSRSFDRKDASAQVAALCRCHPEAEPPKRDFAARDVANIGWSAKLTCQYLRHLGCEVEAIKPWAVRALRSMFGLNKCREDLRNHAVDAFLIAHFDSYVMRPAFDRLPRGDGYEEIYGTRALVAALATIEHGEGVFELLERNIDRLERILPTIGTAHRPENRWNPGDPPGGSFGAVGRENILAFRPNLEERKRLTRLLKDLDASISDDTILTRRQILDALSAIPDDDRLRKRREAIVRSIVLKYRPNTTVKMDTALPLKNQPGAFIDARGKFALAAATAERAREVLPTATFARMNASERASFFAAKRPVYRQRDTIVVDNIACVVTGLEASGALKSFPIDLADPDDKFRKRPTVPASAMQTPPLKLAFDVLGRQIHRLRKDPGGLQPQPYRLRG